MGKEVGKTVFVGVSGGVDSSVSAALLKDQGYNVVGVFIRTWQPDFIECTWRDERRDAMRVCAHLNIPFLECDAEETYKKGVADYMIEEYKKGNTPNPDVMCNREVKFGVFCDFAKERGADYIATGHYARVDKNKENIFEFKKGFDESKDQSYFLWTLKQKDLSHILFPIGHLKKTEVRKLAEKYKLPTATKKDSQGVCFLGPLDMKDFLKHYIEPKKGDVLDEIGNIVGHHNGAVFFTLGERHGFTITKKTSRDKAYYIISKDINKNTITVSNLEVSPTGAFSLSPRVGSSDHSKKTPVGYALKNINWMIESPNENKKYTAQIRYHGEQLICKIKKNNIIFNKPVIVSPGQSIVIYDKEICLGGGIVS